MHERITGDDEREARAFTALTAIPDQQSDFAYFT